MRNPALLKLLPLVLLFKAVPAATAAASLVPLAPANSWTLRNPYSSSPVRMTVEWSRSVGAEVHASVLFSNPVFSYSFLLVSSTAGVSMEGYVMGGVEYRFAAPVPLFMPSSTVGKTWTSEMGTVKLLAANFSISTPTGTIDGCNRYELTMADGSVQVWTVAPGIGFVQFGDPAWAFTLETLDLRTLPVNSPVNSPCPRLGLSAIPWTSGLTYAQREGALKVGIGAGMQMMNVTAPWKELEPSPGVYRLDRVKDELKLAKAYGLPTVLTIGTIFSGAPSLPSDLAGLSWDDPRIATRFASLLINLAPYVPSQVKWLNVGYEVDIYLSGNPNQVAPYRQFLDTIKPYSKAILPISTGLVFSFDTVHHSTAVFAQLDTFGDHLAFDYYAITANYQQRSANSAPTDLMTMNRLAKGRPLILNEVGYSSASQSGSSRTQQQAFFSNFFAALKTNTGTIVGATVWSLNDMPSADIAQAIAGLSVPEDAVAIEFLGNLGLRDSAGKPKPAWTNFTGATTAFAVQNACQLF